jgi:hypothetical protein
MTDRCNHTNTPTLVVQKKSVFSLQAKDFCLDLTQQSPPWN